MQLRFGYKWADSLCVARVWSFHALLSGIYVKLLGSSHTHAHTHMHLHTHSLPLDLCGQFNVFLYHFLCLASRIMFLCGRSTDEFVESGCYGRCSPIVCKRGSA